MTDDKLLTALTTRYHDKKLESRAANSKMLADEITPEEAFRTFLRDMASIREAIGGPNPFRFFLAVAGEPDDEMTGHPDKEEQATAARMLSEEAWHYKITMHALYDEGMDDDKAWRVFVRLSQPSFDRIFDWAEERVKKCENCGNLFFHERSTARYCSERCQNKAYYQSRKKNLRTKDAQLTFTP